MINVRLLGHAAVLISGTKTIIVDPFISENPKAPITLDAIPKTDFVLITHDHFDHFGDALFLAKRDNSVVVGIHEVVSQSKVAESGVKTIGMNIGGTYKTDGISIGMTPSIHSSAVGSPCGFVIALDEKNIYHGGDTAVFSDMKLIPEIFGNIDLALLPIGGHYGMDIRQAVMAAKFINPKITVPMHYGTWKAIEAPVENFVAECQKENIKAISVNFGEGIDLN